MSVMEAQALDMSSILLQAYEIADLINSSVEVAEYLYWRKQVEQDSQIQEVIKLFDKKKELFDECQRFGQFHPSYHAALEEVTAVQEQMDQFEAVRRFKLAEERLDDLLYTVSSTIAHAVSETIKVPSNKLLPSRGGCGSGGKCNCG